jgi:hypothetical protein
MNKTREYYALFAKTFISLLLLPGWKGGITLVLGFFIGTGYYLITKGWNVMVEQAINAFVYSLALPAAITMIFSIIQFIETPVIIYHKLKAEANKRTFKDIEITTFVFPDGSGFNGVGLNVSSFKPISGEYDVNEFIGKIVLIVLNGDEVGRFTFSEGIELPLIVKHGIMYEINPNKIVAKMNYDKDTSTILFLAEEQNLIKNDSDVCVVTVEMKARVGDLDMEGCLARFKLYRDKNNRLLISNLERFPEREK